MKTPKPYGLDKDQDLRWECLCLAATTSDSGEAFEVLTTAEVFARYVKGDITVGLKGEDAPTGGGGGTEVPPKGDAKVIPLGRRPA